jgi:phosphatidylserine/phosphatidylglycerophosphate/cardiolipin synthase-like enzyme
VDFVRPTRRVPISLIAGQGHYDAVLEEIMHAETSVWIATSNLKELLVEDGRRISRRRGARRDDRYRSVLAVFAELAKKNIELRILHAKYPSRAFRDEFDRHPVLVDGGLELRLCPRVHMKAVIVDGRVLYLGSANWTGAGLGAKGAHRRNFEIGIVTEDESMIDDVQAMFDAIWRGLECQACRLRSVCESPLDLEQRARSLLSVL